MKLILSAAFCLFSFNMQALEYEIQLENDAVTVARAVIMPHEESWPHRDEHPHVVVALKGGVITRIEADGSTQEVNFPTGKAVFREVDPPGQLHKSINNSSQPIELIIIELKNPKT